MSALRALAAGAVLAGAVLFAAPAFAQASIYFDFPGFQVQIGEGDFDDYDDDRGRRGNDRVCFYEHINYGGDSFCVRPGERLRSLGDWDDEISSIRVRGDVEALVCERTRFRGNCAIIDRSIRNVGRRANDTISSIRVRWAD